MQRLAAFPQLLWAMKLTSSEAREWNVFTPQRVVFHVFPCFFPGKTGSLSSFFFRSEGGIF